LEIALRASSHLAEHLPASGRLALREGSRVQEALDTLGIDSDLVMLIVVDGELADVDTPLSDGLTLELIPPISGG
jgi:molybdopterin converting factor small subunit